MSDEDAAQAKSWDVLLGRIRRTLQQYGKEDYLGRADYLVVDDNYGHQRHNVEIHQLRMLAPPVIKSLRALLNEYPQWEIIVAVDIPGKESAWPPMGVTIRRHKIIDGLQRQYLPDEFQRVAYEGSKQA